MGQCHASARLGLSTARGRSRPSLARGFVFPRLSLVACPCFFASGKSCPDLYGDGCHAARVGNCSVPGAAFVAAMNHVPCRAARGDGDADAPRRRDEVTPATGQEGARLQLPRDGTGKRGRGANGHPDPPGGLAGAPRECGVWLGPRNAPMQPHVTARLAPFLLPAWAPGMAGGCWAPGTSCGLPSRLPSSASPSSSPPDAFFLRWSPFFSLTHFHLPHSPALRDSPFFSLLLARPFLPKALQLFPLSPTLTEATWVHGEQEQAAVIPALCLPLPVGCCLHLGAPQPPRSTKNNPCGNVSCRWQIKG